jgi:uncharacterized protein (TIGR02145 family)
MRIKVLRIVFCFAFSLASVAAFSQAGINTDGSAPDNAAMLDVKSTNKGFLPPRMTTAQRNAIVSPVEGLVIYNTDEKALNVYNGTAWSTLSPGPAFACGLSITVNHLVAGGVAPINKTVTYATVTNIPGALTKCWITSNLGADHQATSAIDDTEPSAGWHWQFNRKQGFKHDGTTRTPNTAWLSSIVENSDWTAANDPCALELGNGWRLPTSIEWTNVDASGGWANRTDAFNSALKLHAAGYLYQSTGPWINQGLTGHYWSSKQSGTSLGLYLYFHGGDSSVATDSKAAGFSVRCIKD